MPKAEVCCGEMAFAPISIRDATSAVIRMYGEASAFFPLPAWRNGMPSDEAESTAVAMKMRSSSQAPLDWTTHCATGTEGLMMRNEKTMSMISGRR